MVDGLQSPAVFTQPYSFRNLLVYFLRLGTIGFGGPIVLVGYMERDLVEERRWLTKEEYLRGLALAQLAPGDYRCTNSTYRNCNPASASTV
jgi:chromate transporter